MLAVVTINVSSKLLMALNIPHQTCNMYTHHVHKSVHDCSVVCVYIVYIVFACAHAATQNTKKHLYMKAINTQEPLCISRFQSFNIFRVVSITFKTEWHGHRFEATELKRPLKKKNINELDRLGFQGGFAKHGRWFLHGTQPW